MLAQIQNNDTITAFNIIVDQDFTAAPVALTNARFNGKTITILGSGGEKTISLEHNGSLFSVYGGVSLVLDADIILKGILGTPQEGGTILEKGTVGGTGNNSPLVKVDGGKLTMRTGSKIIDNTSSVLNNGTTDVNAGGVYVINHGEFNMDGGEISGINTNLWYPYEYYTYDATLVGGAVYISNGTFTMSGGSIVRNRSDIMDYYSYSVGGVFLESGTFTMTGGDINNNFGGSYNFNSAASGGVFVYNGTFELQGGTINGNTVNIADLWNRASGGVYVNDGSFAMSGGVIGGNGIGVSHRYTQSSVYAGGGVYVDKSTSFTKTGGTIYGSNAGDSEKNTITRADSQGTATMGYAVYVAANNRKRNTTAETGVNLDSNAVTGWE